MIKNQKNTFRINRFNNFILTLIFICTFFSGYLNTSIPTIILIFYIFLVYLFEIKITYIQMIIIFIFISYSILITINSFSWLSSLINLKWFYGIIFFLILFRIENVRIFFYQKLSSNKLFLFFLFLLIFETFLINFIFSPNEFYLQESSSSKIDFYNRPLGLAGNSSATATLIIAWYFSLNIKKNKIFIFLTYTFVIFCLMSGTGFILYIISILISQWSQILKKR